MYPSTSSTIINNVIISVINLIFVGLIMTLWLTPLAQRHSQEKEVYYNKRIELANNFIIDSTLYRLNRQRLIFMQLEEKKGKERGWQLDKQFYNNKETYRIARDAYRDKVYRDLQLAVLFFSPPTVERGKNFITWDSTYATKNVAEKLLCDAEVENWQNSITKLMQQELKA